jgi:hypothetical protein
MMQKMNKNGFNQCAGAYIERLRKEGRYSTAHVYKNALFSFSKFFFSITLLINLEVAICKNSTKKEFLCKNQLTTYIS